MNGVDLVDVVGVRDDRTERGHELVALPAHLDREHRAELGVAHEQV